METVARRSSSGGIFEGLYKVLMRRNSVYVTFVIAGALIGERLQAVDYGVHQMLGNDMKTFLCLGKDNQKSESTIFITS